MTLWQLFWPVLSAGLLSGVIAGLVAFREVARRRRRIALGSGLAASLAFAMLWLGPLGAADRLTLGIERTAARTLTYYEMSEVQARLIRAPLRRQMILSGVADDFQRAELVRIMGDIPAVSYARWSAKPATLPLVAEVALAGLLGLGLGLLIAYLAEMRRRSNAEWRW